MTVARSLAAAQTIPKRGDVEANLEGHSRLIHAAAEGQARVLVFPELSLTGYELDLADDLAFSENDPRLTPLVELASPPDRLPLLHRHLGVASIRAGLRRCRVRASAGRIRFAATADNDRPGSPLRASRYLGARELVRGVRPVRSRSVDGVHHWLGRACRDDRSSPPPHRPLPVPDLLHGRSTAPARCDVRHRFAVLSDLDRSEPHSGRVGSVRWRLNTQPHLPARSSRLDRRAAGGRPTSRWSRRRVCAGPSN